MLERALRFLKRSVRHDASSPYPPPNEFPEGPVPSDLNALADKLSHLASCLELVVDSWMRDGGPEPLEGYSCPRSGCDAARALYLWKNVLIPGGQLLFAAHDANAFHSMPRLQNYFSGWSIKAIRAARGTYGIGMAPRRGDNWTCGAMARNLVYLYRTKVHRLPGYPSGGLDEARIIAKVFRELSNIIRDAESSSVSDS